MRKHRLWMRRIILILPTIGALIWTLYPAMAGLTAGVAFSVESQFINDKKIQTLELTEKKRLIQQHFRHFGIYIPTEDITFYEETQDPKSPLFFMRKLCGKGKLYIWVPLKFRVPILGEKVVEWCLNQQVFKT